MSRIVTQSKLNELTGKNIDYGKGGYCPHYQTIVSLWGSVVASSNYQPNQLVKEEDIVVDKDLFLINAETGSLYFAGGGTYAQIPAIDGHEDFIYIAGGGEAIGSNGTKRLLLQNTASTFDQSNKILDLPDYSRQVIKINT